MSSINHMAQLNPLVFRISMYMTFPVAFTSSSKHARPAGLPFLDTTFAFANQTQSAGVQVNGLYDARTTIEFCVLSSSKYTVWAFSDFIHRMEPISEKEATDFPYGHPNMEEQIGVHQDPIASGALLDANLPIEDPRDYALRVMHFHLNRVVKNWQDAVHLFEAPFEAHVRQGFGIGFQNLVISALANMKTSAKALLAFCRA